MHLFVRVRLESASFLDWYEAWLDRALKEWARYALPTLPIEGDAHEHAGVTAARPLLERALAPATPNAEALRTLGYLRLYQRAYGEADVLFERAAARGGDEPEPRRRLDRARVRRCQSRWEEVREEVAAGLALEGWWATHDALRAEDEQALHALGRRSEALACLDLRASEHGFEVAIHHRLARERLRDGDIDAAHAALLRAIDLGAGILPSAAEIVAAVEAGEPPPEASQEAKVRGVYDTFVGALRREGAHAEADALETRRPPVLPA